jgi:DUF4097 and DUF4098 domain-containing protein YvlB
MCYKKLFTLGLLAATVQFGAALAEPELQQEFHETYPLQKLGRVRLDNVNGSVHIATWDREEVKVDAIKKAKTQEHLDEVKIEVKAKSDYVEIKTKYPEGKFGKGKNNSTSVDYTLTVPKQSRLYKITTVNGGVDIENAEGDVAAESVNGSVKATGLAGEVRLSTVNGQVNAAFLEVKKDVSLESVNGSISLAVPPQANADVSLSTVNGGIHSDFPLPNNKHTPGGQHIKAKLGDGGPAIKMSSVNGGIRILRGKEMAAENP